MKNENVSIINLFVPIIFSLYFFTQGFEVLQYLSRENMNEKVLQVIGLFLSGLTLGVSGGYLIRIYEVKK